MKRTLMIIQTSTSLALASLVLLTACKKDARQQQTTSVTRPAASSLHLSSVGDTLLNVNYESGTLNSGIPGVTATGAPAPDAAYMISPGATGNYGIAHKVIFGDSSYVSAGHYRSESDADSVYVARFLPGNIRRYEFSVLLSNWPIWDSSQPVSQPVISESKITGPAYVPCQIMAKRNAFVARFADASYTTLVSDFSPYINQWVKFRIDVSWSTTTSGYMNIYTELPGDTSYTLRLTKTNVVTYTGNGTTDHGYIKWGVYDGPTSGTRIDYHDDIHVIALN